MRGVLFTVPLVAAAWAAWHFGGEAAGWVGFEELDVLVQFGAVFLVLSMADRVLSRK